jgi:sugar phosphate isomerase/epimerase
MRLGGTIFRVETADEIEGILPKLDIYGLSAIQAPRRIAEMTPDEALEYGERARSFGVAVGEGHIHVNVMTRDLEARAERIELVRTLIRRAVDMGSRCALIMLGSVDPSDGHATPHPYMFTEECKAEFGEVVLKILDGLELGDTRFVIEPWNHSFFYQPRDIFEFIKRIDHPSFGLHLDQMNMVDQAHYYHTTELINETFDLLTPYIASVHFKDVRWDPTYMLMKFDEVLIGDGVLDYHTYLSRLKDLDSNLTGYCEHMTAEGDFAVNFARLHYLADEVGLEFLTRQDALAGAEKVDITTGA